MAAVLARWWPGVLGAALVLAPMQVSGQTAEEFYKNKKQLQMLVSSAAGGGYDGYARIIAKTMSKYLPGNPTWVVTNMPGAGGVVAANHLANIAPKDGSVISIMDRGLPTAALLYGQSTKTQFDALKLGWVGNAMSESGMAVVAASSKVQTIEQAMKEEVTFGASGPETDPAMFARLLNALIGTKFKTVNGYKGQPEIVLAIEKNELDGLFMSGWGGLTSDHLVKGHHAGKFNFMVQMSRKPAPEVGNTPLITQYIKNEDDRAVIDLLLTRLELGRPFAAPPDVPADRLKLLREAFMKSLSDKELLEEAAASKRNINPMSGEEVEAVLKKLYATPRPVIERIQKIVKLQD